MTIVKEPDIDPRRKRLLEIKPFGQVIAQFRRNDLSDHAKQTQPCRSKRHCGTSIIAQTVTPFKEMRLLSLE